MRPAAAMCGLGGVSVEVLNGISFDCQFGADEARRMIDEIRGRAIFGGTRGRRACDVNAPAATLARMSEFGAGNAAALQNSEHSPLTVGPMGTVARKALIVPAAAN